MVDILQREDLILKRLLENSTNSVEEFRFVCFEQWLEQILYLNLQVINSLLFFLLFGLDFFGLHIYAS